MAPRGVELYRAILKVHRAKIPWDLRQLGNAYLRNEFQLHKKVDDPKSLKQFYSAWEDYLKATQQKESKFGQDLTDADKRTLSEEQEEKLQELKKEAKNNNDLVNSKFDPKA